ncbi:hypothetical protein GCM10027592_23850 [Spirosoma flavus]
MRPVFMILLAMQLISCVDPEEGITRGTVDVLVVDGIINNVAEPQIIRLNRSKSDPFSGRTSFTPISKATVDVVVDSADVIPCHETVDGTYQLPSDFKGQAGHAYQLRFTLADGTRYVSDQQILPAYPVPSIDKVTARFSRTSLFPPLDGSFAAAHDLFIELRDPAEAHNYYRWDWKLWEKQEWCRTCQQGVYSIYGIRDSLVRSNSSQGNYYIYTADNSTSLEDCYHELTPPPYSNRFPLPDYAYDYMCRTQCWEILYGPDSQVYDDLYTNGGLITGLKVAQIPFYTYNSCLIEIRQSSLTADAYRYFKAFQDQAQRTGGLADTPPSALAGNVKNIADRKEVVIGFFTAAVLTPFRYWLDRKDAFGVSFGGSGPAGYKAELFYALNRRQPIAEPILPAVPQMVIRNSPNRPPTALCLPNNNRTPRKPEGWRD